MFNTLQGRTPFPLDLHAPACTLASSCDDTAKLAEFLLNKGEVNGARLLQPKSIDRMWTRYSGTPWYDALGDYYGALLEGYGFGWYVGEQDGHRTGWTSTTPRILPALPISM